MRVFVIILSFFILTSCIHRSHVDKSINVDSLRVDSIYGNNTWLLHFQIMKTPLGRSIKLKLINDSSYMIQWGDSLKLKTYPQTFLLDGHKTWIPQYISENKDFIVMRQGCGNPCWVGYFLPINDSLKPHTIHEYLDFDLDNNLVASIKDSNIIEVKNLKTNSIENHILNGCNSVFLGYCIDSLTIKNGILKYNWIPKTTINSKKYQTKIEKIGI